MLGISSIHVHVVMFCNYILLACLSTNYSTCIMLIIQKKLFSGINKTASAASPKDEISGPEPNKENTLANILANIKEYQNLNNG